MLWNDPIVNVLYIDLSKKEFHVEKRPDLFGDYIGGTGVATALLMEECPQGIDPFDENNPIILAVGALTAHFPLASKTVAMFKSPHTGNLGESHCGGRSAVSIRMAGYGAIVIKGKSDLPIYISIKGSDVRFRDATTLWGMQSNDTVGKVIRDNEEGAGERTIMRIGRAGENLVTCACVTTETYRHFGRLGLGAVFGSKKLKAIAISGVRSLPVKDKPNYRKVYKEIYDKAVSSPLMKKYHDLGTAGNVDVLNNLNSLPTKNLQSGKFDGVETITGEYFAEHFLGRRLACSHCPVGCIHIAALREPYENEPYFYKTSMICYDYEPIFSIGSFLGISDSKGFLKLMDVVETLGFDVMSIGVILGWTTEAFEKKLITEKDTEGIKPQFGDWEAYIDLLELIVRQPNDFYKALAKGAEFAASKYGGLDFALCLGGNEMSGYHTGPAAHLGYTLGTRHSHLDNAGYSVDQKSFKKEELTPESIVDKLITEEKWRQILSSLVICFFARGIYDIDLTKRALDTVGMSFSEKEILEIGEKIYKLKYEFKFREGFSLENVRFPKRIFDTKALIGPFDEKFMRKAVKYFEKRLGV